MLTPLLAEADTVITAVITGIVSVITAVGATWALMKRTRIDSQLKADEAEEAREIARRKEDKKNRKDSLDECWELYNEVKSENIDLRVAAKLADRKIRRLESVLRTAGIALPDLSDHDFDEPSGGVVPPTNPNEGPSGGDTSGPRRPPTR